MHWTRKEGGKVGVKGVRWGGGSRLGRKGVRWEPRGEEGGKVGAEWKGRG